jgi:hypothetical protein
MIPWPKRESPLVPCTKCQRICEKPLFPTRRHEQNGRTLRRSRAMSGSAGLSPSRNRKPENSTSRGCVRSLRKECAGLVVGPVVLTVKAIDMQKSKGYIEHPGRAVETGGKFKHVMAISLDPRADYKEGVIRCIKIGGHASPGPLFPKNFIDVGKGKLLGAINGREANQRVGQEIKYGAFSVGLFIYDYKNGKINWVSPEPFIQDSEARTITFASQFVEQGNGNGILYAHVDDSFIRAYTLNAEEIQSLLS